MGESAEEFSLQVALAESGGDKEKRAGRSTAIFRS